MKQFSIYVPMSKEYFDSWTKRIERVSPEHTMQPKEDHHLISQKYPIYVVADGVTLKRDLDGNYPDPSGSGELAKIFCETVIEEAEKIYDIFTEADTKNIFVAGNKAAEKYNNSHGRLKEKLDYREFDFFACTTAFFLIKDDKVYWWSLHDSGIVIVDADTNEICRSPDTWSQKEKNLPDRECMTETEWNKSVKRTYRNAPLSEDKIVGYGVVTGEDVVVEYLNTGAVDVFKGCTVLLYTDGFANYIKLPQFLKLFQNWPLNTEQELGKLSESKIKENPQLYGQERSLIVVKI